MKNQEKTKIKNMPTVCKCEMPVKIKGKNQCWRCKKPFKELLENQEKETAKEIFRKVKVTFSNGDSITTNMNPRLTDQEIKDYYKIGRSFNIGNGEHDNMQTVSKVEILK